MIILLLLFGRYAVFADRREIEFNEILVGDDIWFDDGDDDNDEFVVLLLLFTALALLMVGLLDDDDE